MSDTKTVKIIAKFHREVPDGNGGERKEHFVSGQQFTGPRELMDIWINEHKVAEEVAAAPAEQ